MHGGVPPPVPRRAAPPAVGRLEAKQPRARALGLPFAGRPGRWNAITDVPGVEVGYKTLISGEGRLAVGKGPVRTGVSAILPRGKHNNKSVFADYFAGNGNGDMTGTHWIDESGVLETPILITNTGSVGVVRDAAVAWMVKHELYVRPLSRHVGPCAARLATLGWCGVGHHHVYGTAVQ